MSDSTIDFGGKAFSIDVSKGAIIWVVVAVFFIFLLAYVGSQQFFHDEVERLRNDITGTDYMFDFEE